MSLKGYDVIVVRVPSKNKLVDHPISFPPLSGLHLELLENKKKLKAGLPLIPFKTKAIITNGKSRRTGDSSPMINGSGGTGGTGGIGVAAVTGAASLLGKPGDSDSEGEKSRHRSRDNDREMLNSLGKEEPFVSGSANVGVSPQQSSGGSGDRASDKKEEDKPEEDEEPAEPEKTPEELEEEERQELKWRFKILKKSHPQLDVPEFHDHSDIKIMRRSYDDIKRGIHLDSSVATYKKFLVGAFMGIEFISTKFGKVDLTGLTKQQMREMDKYEELLIELGEKSYTTFGSNLPVELRLLFLVVLNSCLFYVGKIISDRGGDSVFELFNLFTKQTPDEKNDRKSNKMRGPSINLDDIKKMSAG